MRTSARAWLIVMVLLEMAVWSSAQSNSFGDLHWRMIGPFRGGRAVAASGVTGNGTTFYFGAVDGGVWKTEDAGMTWKPLFDHQKVASIGALEVAESDPNVIYAGTGESDIRSDLASGDGVYKSIDGGQTWKNIGLGGTRQISRIVIDPQNPEHVLVAALGHAYGPSEMRGVFVSEDGGASWTKSLYRGPEVGAADIALAPDNPKIVAAVLWEAHRPPWSTYAPIQGPGSGLFISKDGGHSWTAVSGLPTEKLGRMGVAIARGTRGRRLYVSVDAGDASGLYRSDDGAASWKRVNADPRITSRAWYFSCLTVDPNNPDVVYMPNVATYRLSAGGTNLAIVRGAPGGDDYHQLWIDPVASQHMVLASDQGTVVSLDGGTTWSSWYNQPTAQLYHVITDNAYPYTVYGAQQDSGSVSVPSRTDHGSIDLTDMSNVGGSESGYVAPDPKDPNVFFVSGTFGTVDRFDRRLHQSQNIAPWPAPASLGPPYERKYRDPWTPVLVFSPIQKNALYLGTQYVMRTLNGGMNWQTISPDLTGTLKTGTDDKTPLSNDSAEERGYGVVYAIAPSPLAASQIWAGTDTGLVHLTRNGGGAWSNVTPPGLRAFSKISQIEASHFSAGEAFLAVDSHRLDDMTPHAYRTRDFGKTWQSITSGIGEHDFVRVIREDPKHRGLLFAGTEFGVYVSFDDGDHWQSLQLNLPVTSIRDLVVHDDDLVLATHGRSFWIMDDMVPLRQMTEGFEEKTQLLTPAQAVRTISDSFLGTPLPVDEPQAENPPRGAYIDYVLGDGVSGPVTLEFLNREGESVRRYTSGDKPEAPSTKAAIAPRWLHAAPSLSGEPGVHRFVWDLRYEHSGAGSMGDDDDEDADFPGPFVLPGTYRVRLTTSGGKFEKTLQVIADPRSTATAPECAQQFTWAKKAFQDVVMARKLTASMKEAHPQANSSEAEQLQKQLNSVTRDLMAALAAFNSSDRAPTAQAIELFKQSDSKLAAYQKQHLPMSGRKGE